MSTTTYDTNSNQFAVSAPLILGHLWQQYQEELYLAALSTPSEYSKCRANVIQKVKIGVVSDLYKNLREILCEGKQNGTPLIRINGVSFVPNHPPQSADARILSIAKTMDSQLSEIIDLIIPPFSDVLKNRMESKAV